MLYGYIKSGLTYGQLAKDVSKGFLESKIGHRKHFLNKNLNYIASSARVSTEGIVYVVMVLCEHESNKNVGAAISLIKNSKEFDSLFNQNKTKLSKYNSVSDKEVLEYVIMKYENSRDFFNKPTSQDINGLSNEMYLVFKFALNYNLYTSLKIKNTYESIESEHNRRVSVYNSTKKPL